MYLVIDVQFNHGIFSTAVHTTSFGVSGSSSPSHTNWLMLYDGITPEKEHVSEIIIKLINTCESGTITTHKIKKAGGT